MTELLDFLFTFLKKELSFTTQGKVQRKSLNMQQKGSDHQTLVRGTQHAQP
jgi:hypothetical protein